jgi:cytochrome c oxidase assembly protein subunit 15
MKNAPLRPFSPITTWLILCCGMVFLAAIIGAITRLTESGLSITRWEPVKGILPPLNDAAWNDAFALYRQSPQYGAINQGMTLEAFKGIYFWEWIHRLWGRLIGIVYAMPLLFFFIRGMVPAGFKTPLLIGLALGGMQGVIGWFMVQSGLEPGQASVSALRLALHLSLALFIYGFLYWQILRLHAPPSAPVLATMRKHAHAGLVLITLTIIWGAFTAGLDAGKIYPTFPLMNGALLPPEFAALHPAWLNALENPATVQFIHRWLAVITVLVLTVLAMRLHEAGEKKLAYGLGGTALLQLGLGVSTLATGVNIVAATLHQANAIVTLTMMLTAFYRIKKAGKA